MSKQVDERVVSMQFDNKHFERNVATTMSTLDKLKQALHFKDASKGIDDTTEGMSGIGAAVQTVSTKFSAMQVMAVTALANITNSAVNAGKQIVKSLTIDPVKDGFQEYEMTLNAVQTTMAATGKTSKEVEKELKKLDEYADKTVYGTADMLNNLPKFTNAGVELEKATTAMIGIANATALAGGDASKASIAFYNLGQAIGTGYLTRMDYNSINNAGIATMEWKNQMVEAAIAQGTLTKVGEDAYEAGNKTLTLQQLFIDGLQEQWATTEVMMKVFGDYGDETTEIGKKAYSAAQDIKTYTQMMESLKATAGTGWKDTWQTIIGGLEGAKEFWTGLNDLISGFLTKTADWRNTVLESALGTKFADLVDLLGRPGQAAEKAVASLEYYQDIVNRVWNGDYKNQPFRWDLLEDAGYNYAVVQSLVDKGYKYKLTIEDINEAIAKWGSYGKNIVTVNRKVVGSQTDAVEATEAQVKTLDELLALTDEELVAMGYLQEQIDALREVAKWAKVAGVSVAEFLAAPEKFAGRTMLIDSFKELGKVLGDAATAAKMAWQEIFPPKSTEEWAFMIYGWIGALKQFTSSIKDLIIKDGQLTDTGEKLKRTFKGLFAIIDIVWKILGGGFRFALEVVKAIIGLFGLDILDLTAALGDAIVGFHDFLDATLSVKAVIEWMAPAIKAITGFFINIGKAVSSVFGGISIHGLFDEFKDWIEYLKTVEDLPTAIAEGIVGTFGRIGNFMKKLFKSIGTSIAEQFGTTPQDIISGLVNGLVNGIKIVGQVIFKLGEMMLAKFRESIDSHSPSKETEKIGEDFVSGFIIGLKNFAGMIWETIMTIGTKAIDIIKELDFGKVVAGVVSGGLVVGFVKIASGFGDLLEEGSQALAEFGLTLKAYRTNLKAEALKSIAIAIGILVASVIALAFVPADKLWVAIGALTIIAGVLTSVSILVSQFGKDMDFSGFVKFGSMMLSFSSSILLLAIAIKLLSSIDVDSANVAIVLLGSMITGMITLCGAFVVLAKTGKTGDLAMAGSAITQIGVAILLMSIALKTVTKLASKDPEALWQAVLVIGAFGALIVGLMAATKLATGGQKINTLGATIAAAGAAILLMALSTAIIAKLASKDPAALETAVGVIAIFGGVIAGLLVVTRFAGGGAKIKNLGATLLAAGAAILLMTISTKIIAKMAQEDPESLKTAIVMVGLFAGIIVGLMAATKLVGTSDLKRVGTTLLLASVSIAILAATAVLLSLIDTAGLAKGITAVGMLAGFMAGLIYMTKFSQDFSTTLMPLSIAIAILAAAVIALSFIDPAKLVAPTIAMGLLMGMLALVIASTGKSTKAVGTLIIIAGMVAIFAGVLWLLAGLPVENVIGSAVALSTLMLSLTAVMFILSKVGGITVKALLGMAALTLLAIPLLAFVGVLYLMQGIQNVTTNVLALVVMATALTLLLPVLALCGALIYPALFGLAALTLMAVPLLAFIGILAIMQNIQDAEKNINLVLTMMGSMTVMLLAVSSVAPLAIIAVTALTMLGTLMITLAGIAGTIGALVTWFPDLQTWLDNGIPIMIQLAGGLGEMMGAFIAGISKQIMAIMPDLGMALSMFMINALPFISIAKTIDWSVAEGATILAAAVIALTAAQAVEGIVSFLNGGLSFSGLGTELSLFMMNALPFLTTAKAIGPEVLDGVKNLAEGLLLLTAADLISAFTGGISFDSFGEDCGKLGAGIKQFRDGVGDLTEEDLKAIDMGSQAMSKIAQATKDLPKTGGLWQAIVGENGFASFTAALAEAGPNIKTFITSVGTFTTEDITTCENAGKAISALGTAAKDIPNEGGLWQKITGESGFKSFLTTLSESGGHLRSFVNGLGEGGFNETDYNNCKWAADAIAALGLAADKLPETGGWSQKLSGEKDLAGFIDQISGAAESIVDLSTKVSGINTVEIDSVAAVISACADLAHVFLDKGFNTYSSSVNFFNSFGSDLAGFTGKLCDINSHAESINSNKIITLFNGTIQHILTVCTGLIGTIRSWKKDSLYNFGSDLAGFTGKLCDVNKHGESIDTDQIKKVTESITALANTIKGVIDLNLDDAKVSSFNACLTTLGETGVEGLVNGFENAPEKVNAAINKMVEEAIKQINSKHDQFYNAGVYLAMGFANGIQSKQGIVYAERAGTELGTKALAALNRTIEVASPSKATFRSGGFFAKGFANGMIDNLKGVYDASSETGSEAMHGLSDAISKISKAVSLDIDTQPTIRPVLDLSDVRAGAGMIGSLFDTNPSVGLLANVGAINSMMNNQNGANDDVISAINALSKRLGDVGGTQYNINGVSINEDEAVIDAVKTIVRAARIERRV